MSSDQYKESKYVVPYQFEFDEDFDPECFEENHQERNLNASHTK
jgi:hypothetical protein